MLTAHVIDRLVFAADPYRLIQSLIDNGLPCPLSLRARLAHPAAAHSLALRRLCQLTFGPSDTRDRLVEDLLQRCNPDGSFPGSADADPLATAAAVAGLEAVLSDHRVEDPAALVTVRDQALAALAGLQQSDGLFAGADDRTREDRELTSAFILFLLGHDPVFLGAIRCGDLFNYFDERHTQLDAGVAELILMARLHTDPAMILAA